MVSLLNSWTHSNRFRLKLSLLYPNEFLSHLLYLIVLGYIENIHENLILPKLLQEVTTHT